MTEPKTLSIKRPPSQDVWLVWRPGTSRVRRRHRTESQALAEAIRLKKQLGGTYYVCKAMHRIGPDDEVQS